MPTLRLMLPDLGEITHELTAPRIGIGRWPDNAIQIIDRSVSAHHAELIAEGGHYRLHDLGSTNLSFVDGQPVTDFHLHQPCQITFGTVQGEFDPLGDATAARLSAAQMEKDLAFLRGENAELQGKIIVLQRQVDILSSARLVTKKADTTPYAAHTDSLKAIVSERDDLRHMNSGLKLELEQLREELSATASERDAARQACEHLQSEKLTREREAQEVRRLAEATRLGGDENAAPAPQTDGGRAAAVAAVLSAPVLSVTATSPSSATTHPKATMAASPDHSPLADSSATQKIQLPLSTAFQAVAEGLKPVRASLETLAKDTAQTVALAELATYVRRLGEVSVGLGGHPILRIVSAIEALIHDFAGRAEPPEAAHISTLSQATDLIGKILESQPFDRSQNLPAPKVLVVETDPGLRDQLSAAFEIARMSITACAGGREAFARAAEHDFDLLVIDLDLPLLDNRTVCSRLQEIGRHQKTPVVFLTGADIPADRVEASPSSLHEYFPRPFDTAELVVKAETWIWKNHFALL